MAKKAKKSAPRTYHLLVLDKSGSMAATKNATIEGFNEKVQQLKIDSETQDIRCCLVTFNGEVFEHLWDVPASKLVEATPEEFIPMGNTAMCDAIGFGVQKLIDTTDYENINNSYVVDVISDGQTNADKHYQRATLKELIDGCEATKRWTITYSGCSKDYLEQIARQTGVNVNNCAVWSNASSAEAKVSFKNMRSRQTKYYAERAMGSSGSATYASDGGGVATYLADSVSEVAAPVINSAEELVKATANVDFKDVLSRQPKYVDDWPKLSNPWDGKSLFSNNNKVEWQNEPKDSFDIPANLAGSALNGSSLLSQALNRKPFEVNVSVMDFSKNK